VPQSHGTSRMLRSMRRTKEALAPERRISRGISFGAVITSASAVANPSRSDSEALGQHRGAISSRPNSSRRRRYCAGSFWRVALTPDKIPSPISTIARTAIQCGGTCIKCAPYTRPMIKIAYPVAYSPKDMAFPFLPNPRNPNFSIAESPRQARRVQRYLIDAVRTTSVTDHLSRCTVLALPVPAAPKALPSGCSSSRCEEPKRRERDNVAAEETQNRLLIDNTFVPFG
jgi:hypothetical protein